MSFQPDVRIADTKMPAAKSLQLQNRSRPDMPFNLACRRMFLQSEGDIAAGD